MISISHMSFGYSVGKPIFNGLTYRLEAESLAIVGPSGAGKSTLLKLIKGELCPTSGSIEVLGQDISKLKSYSKLAKFRRQHLGIINQQPVMINELTAAENVALGAALNDTPMREAISKANDLLDNSSVNPQQTVTTLSGGELSRVEICRAIINNPEIIISDEPSASLDQKILSE